MVFRCNPRLGEVEFASCADWNRATDKIMVAPAYVPDERFRELQIKDASGKLVYRNRIVPTVGRTALHWAPSLDGSLIAVLSAEREREYQFNPIPFMGGNRGPARGKRMHELFAFPEMTPISEAVVLPRCEDGDPIPIWSADSQYVIYFDQYVLRAWFVRVKKPGDSHP